MNDLNVVLHGLMWTSLLVLNAQLSLTLQMPKQLYLTLTCKVNLDLFSSNLNSHLLAYMLTHLLHFLRTNYYVYPVCLVVIR